MKKLYSFISAICLISVSSLNADTLYYTKVSSSGVDWVESTFTIKDTTTNKLPTASDDIMVDWSVNSTAASNLYLRKTTYMNVIHLQSKRTVSRSGL